MARRILIVITALAVTAVGVVPSQAAAKKKKPDFKGSYSVTLYPDPTEDVLGLNGGCNGKSPMGTDKRPFTVPGAGKLMINLVSPDPTGKGVTDWDLYLKNSDDVYVGDGGNGGGSNEILTATFKKKETFELQICNLLGSPSGTVSWVFKYA